MKNVVSSIARLWPGFSGVVRRGLWDQLAIALLFGAICRLTLAANFLWVDFLSKRVLVAIDFGAFVAWVVLGAVANARLRKYEKKRDPEVDGETFLEAQTHYLRGNWFETECCLKSALKKNPYDAEALLLLATLYRHVKRFSEAKKTLAELEKLDAAERWYYEIALEKQAIEDDKREARAEEKEAREAEKTRKQALKSPQPQSVAPSETVAQPASPPSETPPPNVAAIEKTRRDENDVVSLETVDRNLATGRPILKFCLNAGGDASDGDDAAEKTRRAV